MIDINKKYRTRGGNEVRIYATDGRGLHAIHGAFKDHDEWRTCTWQENGVNFILEGPFDLVEVKPRIQRTVWLNVFPKTIATYFHRLDADTYAGSSRIACVKVEIDCEEGEGL
jgi:hypothetical protein